MKIVCAWCKKELEDDGSNGPVSHGICEECSADMLSRSAGSLQTFLDKLDYPVLLINNETLMESENNKLRELVGKDSSQIQGHKGGEVFECIHHKKPGGCGKTVCCKACAIRNCVEETFKTGKANLNVEATLKSYIVNQEKHVSSVISTNKVGDYVLLEIKDFKID